MGTCKLKVKLQQEINEFYDIYKNFKSDSKNFEEELNNFKNEFIKYLNNKTLYILLKNSKN